MADSKISALSAASSALTTHEFAVNEGGTSKKVTGAQLKSFITPISVVALSSDATANSTTTGVEITGLNTTTGTGTLLFWYYIRHVSGATTTGLKFGVNHTGTTTAFIALSRIITTGTTAVTAVQTNASGTTPVIVGGNSVITKSTTAPNLGPWTDVNATTDQLTIIEGMVVVTVDGDLELWHASDAAASSTVKAGSSLILTKVV